MTSSDDEKTINMQDNFLVPRKRGNFVNYEPAMLVEPGSSWPVKRHPLNPHLSTERGDQAYEALREAERQEGAGEAGLRSRFNGYKLQSPDIAAAVGHLRSVDGVTTTNPAQPYTEDPQCVEVAQVIHRRPSPEGSIFEKSVVDDDDLNLSVGDKRHAELPAGLMFRSARTFGHTHPPGPYQNWEPSIRDQLVAREHPHVQSFVKVPNVHGKENVDIIQFSGAWPPRHYVSLPNPDGIPVAPDSPDLPPTPGGSLRYPSFKLPPDDYKAETRLPGPHGYESRSPSPADLEPGETYWQRVARTNEGRGQGSVEHSTPELRNLEPRTRERNERSGR